MGLINGLQVGFRETYPNEPNQAIPALLSGIPRSELLRVVSGLLAEQIKGRDKIRDLLGFWFRAENQEFANDAYARLRPIEEEFKKLIIAGVPGSLKLYSYALNHLTDERLLTDPQIEVNLFKAFLVQNDLLNRVDDKVTETTENLPFELRWCGSHFAQAVRFTDVVNFDLHELFISEFIRAVMFFEFLVSREDTNALLIAFYRVYNVQSWNQYLQQLSGISFSVLKKTNAGFLELTVQPGETYERDVAFLDTLSSVPYDELTDHDFKALREKPLQKIGEGSYRIIYGLFCIERIFKGLYFILKAVNQTLLQGSKVRDLRGLYTYKFSEQHALYTVLKRAFPKKYKCISGEEITNRRYDGGPDYYARNGNKAFLFESKDSLINAEIKETGDFTMLLEDLKSKFYVDGNSPKAVLQLLNGIRDIFSGRFLAIDGEYKKDFIRVYPIVVIHDRQLDVPGFNKILNHWFIPELQKTANAIDITRIKPITVMDTTTLVLTHELLNSRQIMLEDAIDEYHSFTSFKKRYRSYAELMQHGRDTNLPFSYFIKQLVRRRKLKRYPERFLKEKSFIGLNSNAT